MHIDFFVEEPSAKVALERFVPKIVGEEDTINIVNFTGKKEMIRKLPDRLRAYSRRIRHTVLKVAVLIDLDSDDCKDLKRLMENIAAEAGLITKTNRGAGEFHLLNRIAIEELEAWFFGDVPALRGAYPRLPESLASKARYRNPDAIKGGTAEALHRELRNAGYYGEVFPKVEVARMVSEHMDPSKNRSASFNAFRNGLEALAA